MTIHEMPQEMTKRFKVQSTYNPSTEMILSHPDIPKFGQPHSDDFRRFTCVKREVHFEGNGDYIVIAYYKE